MKVAVIGCLHGMLNDMFDEILEYEQQRAVTIDLILVCGDCQTIRHSDDLQCLSVPPKYRKLGDFPEYYSGSKTVPKLTIFIGGNHECSNYLMTLPYGGWVCKNMYFLGNSGVVNYRGLRIAGVSGIYNHAHCNKGRFERMPLDQNSIRSIYHMRRLDVLRLELLQRRVASKPIDIFLSHDWPSKVYDFGNRQQLLRFKPAFKQDIESRYGLGNPLTRRLLFQLAPSRWFAAHLHCKFDARVLHGGSTDGPDEVKKETHFLALDKIENKYKCKNGYNFMDVIDIEPSVGSTSNDTNLYHDIEWLTILRKSVKLDHCTSNNIYCPRLDEPIGQSYYPNDEEIEQTMEMIAKTGGLKIEHNFEMVEPVIYNRDGNVQPSLDPYRRLTYSNFQTDQLCTRLNIAIPDYLMNLTAIQQKKVQQSSQESQSQHTVSDQSQTSNNSTIVKMEVSESKPTTTIVKDEGDCLEFCIDTRGEL